MGVYWKASVVASELDASDLGRLVGEYQGPRKIYLDGFLVAVNHEFLAPGHVVIEIVLLQTGPGQESKREIWRLTDEDRFAIFKESL